MVYHTRSYHYYSGWDQRCDTGRLAFIENGVVILGYCIVFFIGHYIFREAGALAKKNSSPN